MGVAGGAFLLAPALVAQSNCTFRVDPDEYLGREARIRRELFEQTRLARGWAGRAADARAVAAGEIPRRNFIDEEIFGKLERLNVPSARPAADEEFFRRIHFDLTGHPPEPAEIREFLVNDSPSKRNEVIDRLLYAPQFVDRWTMWLGDLLQNVTFPSNFDRQYDGRNAYYDWMRLAIGQEKSLKDLAYEAVSAIGNSYRKEEGGANFPLNGITPMGPIQDTYDNMLNRAATTFLGLSHYDCLLCHGGRGRLDQVSLWGATSTRLEAQRMAAFFSRARMIKPRVAASEFFYNSYDVTEAPTGAYDMNTVSGNRPNREPVGQVRSLTPVWQFSGATPGDGNWRSWFASYMVDDPMFARNFANRLWKELFGMALVEPIDSLDPARLDPANPPPEPWKMQATHPELLERLAHQFREDGYNLREFVRLLVQSSAYQLSSRYDGEWKIDYLPLFARHYPRRLEGEEVHDAIVKATGVATNYTIRGLETTSWAIKMPEPVEPRSNGAAVGFMLPFLRGNRDTQPRLQDGSILQQLNLMNDNFVLSRVKVTASAPLRAIAAMPENETVVEELFLRILSRRPSEAERGVSLRFLEKSGAARTAYVEDLAWVLFNKVDFLFNY